MPCLVRVATITGGTSQFIEGRKAGETLLPKASLTYYLENSPAYLGKKVVRFKDILHGTQQYDHITDGKGFVHSVAKSHTELAYCFDYQKLVDDYDINLVSQTEDDDKPDIF